MQRLVVLAIASSLFGAACLESRLDRVLTTPDQIHTLDHRSPYLKVHMKDGGLYLLSKWQVDGTAQQVSGEGDRLGLARETIGSGPFAVALADVALLELRDGTFEFLDNYKGTITGKQRFFPAGTVLGGKRIATA